ncbi:hypothetical protein ACRALDRAFT_2082880, partial [Sodiomyces alcalophilus JCM 7366]|uniref:uncharacterized protein n=1 Tax=Sodiomyces alcalophilus JCM 7366 TaxID=591952 RepID=UPI0039B5E8BD
IYEYVHKVEYVDRYCPGGYHPIEVGDKLQKRYSIVDKLGHGGYSTIWLARDEKLGKYVAVKVQVAEGDHSSKEGHVLRRLSENPAKEFSGHLITPVLDQFHLAGPNGNHSCFVTMPARSSVAESIGSSSPSSFQIHVARALAAQLIMATAYVHRSGFVHGDIHLGNILLQLPGSELDHLSIPQVYEKYHQPEPISVVRTDKQPVTSPSVPKTVYRPNWLGKPSNELLLSEAKLWLTDFGTAFDPSQETRLHSLTHLENRPPEARFEPAKPLTFSSDIWSLALMVFEMMGSGPFMSSFFFVNQNKVTTDHIDALGPLPQEWWDEWEWEAKTKYFTQNGQPSGGREGWTLKMRFDFSIQEPREREGTPHMDDDESRAFLEMMEGMLRFRPEERMTSEQVLRSEWVTKWALPAAEE